MVPMKTCCTYFLVWLQVSLGSVKVLLNFFICPDLDSHRVLVASQTILAIHVNALPKSDLWVLLF